MTRTLVIVARPGAFYNEHQYYRNGVKRIKDVSFADEMLEAGLDQDTVLPWLEERMKFVADSEGKPKSHYPLGDIDDFVVVDLLANNKIGIYRLVEIEPQRRG